MKDRMVCECYNIKISDIKKYIEKGLDTFEKMQSETRIGVLCSACVNDAKTVIEKALRGEI